MRASSSPNPGGIASDHLFFGFAAHEARCCSGEVFNTLTGRRVSGATVKAMRAAERRFAFYPIGENQLGAVFTHRSGGASE